MFYLSKKSIGNITAKCRILVDVLFKLEPKDTICPWGKTFCVILWNNVSLATKTNI